MNNKMAQWISIVTVVPLIAFYVLTTLFIFNKDVFANRLSWYIFSLVFLTLIPLSAYLLKDFFPSFKRRGRKGERKLAFIMGVSGQVLGVIGAFIFKAPRSVKTIFLAYLFSGIILSLVNMLTDHKASGHACGVSGPLTLLLYFISLRFLYTYLILPFVFWSRLKMRRHNLPELFSGTAIGIIATIFGIIVL